MISPVRMFFRWVLSEDFRGEGDLLVNGSNV